MRAFANTVTMERTAQTTRQKLERLPDPIYRFNDPARQTADGTVWAWGRDGRPAALLTLTKHRQPGGSPYWLGELTSLAAGPVSSALNAVAVWQPSTAGVSMQRFPKAGLPADDPNKRLRQMKELVRSIKAYEYFKPNDQASVERYELRVLPQPVHRYADAKSGMIDGGIFMIAYGLNPEVALLVEARRDGSNGPAWYLGFARIAIAELHVELDGKKIWSQEGAMSRRPDDPYWLFTRSIEERAEAH
jgi:hypothetical protein